jgi:hypothetical protein
VVAVTISFRLIPRPPQQSGQGTCRTLRLIGTKVVAGSCTGRGLTPTISLT